MPRPAAVALLLLSARADTDPGGTMQPSDWTPEGIDINRPSAARIYDYLLGGVHNFAVDRDIAKQVIAAMPDAPMQALANRAFLHRAVRYLVDAGVRQFLDLGSGIPTMGNVHQSARRAAPDARVVYVDIDPVATAHSRHIIDGDSGIAVVEEDFRQPERILDHPDLRTVLDLDQPIAVLALAVLHAVPDSDDPYDMVARYRDRLAPGSYLVVAHGSNESRPELSKLMEELSKRTATPMTARSRVEITRFFDGFEVVEPGVVWAPSWHPDSPHEVPENPEVSMNFVGIGRKR